MPKPVFHPLTAEVVDAAKIEPVTGRALPEEGVDLLGQIQGMSSSASSISTQSLVAYARAAVR